MYDYERIVNWDFFIFLYSVLGVFTEEMPATTRSSGETKSVWTKNTDIQVEQRDMGKAQHTILLIVLPILSFFILIVLIVVFLLIKGKKYRKKPSRLHTVVCTASNERNLRKTFSSSDQAFTALVKEEIVHT